MSARIRRTEDVALALVLGCMACLPLAEVVYRTLFRGGIPGQSAILQHLTLVAAMLGAGIAARERRMLCLSNVQSLLRGVGRDVVGWYASASNAVVAALLAYAAWIFVRSEWDADTQWFAGVPAWVIQWVMPVGYLVIGVRSAAGTSSWSRLALIVVCAVLIALYHFAPSPSPQMMLLGGCLLLASAALGAAVFAVLGGCALLLFWGQDSPIASVAIDQYRLVVNPVLPAIPLFTLTGYFLAEGGTPARLVRVFNALFGASPAGSVAIVLLVSALFTAFTGASGITILALGALLMPMVVAAGYAQKSALGLVTSAGSLGVLLPPSLPLILYAVVAKIPMQEFFLRSLGPGLLMLLLVFAWASYAGPVRSPGGTQSRPELRQALKEAKWELALPLVAAAAIFGGWATLVEAAALTAVYACGVITFIHRSLNWRTDLPRVAAESGLMVGGVLLILGVALALTNFLVDAHVPEWLTQWALAHIHDRWAFLLALNAVLLLVGCLMDIFSATVVVVPLIAPIALEFGVDPVHLGIIFLANMELGYLTPPVGMNLFFASSRFGRPLGEVALACLPYVAVMAVGVLLITYLPWLSGS